MKKYTLIALILVLTVFLCACGRNNDTPTMPNPPVENPTPSGTPTVPNMDPTIDTNIPDPEVDPNSTMPGGITSDPSDNGQPGSGNTFSESGAAGTDNESSTGNESGSAGEQSGTDSSRNRMRRIK